LNRKRGEVEEPFYSPRHAANCERHTYFFPPPSGARGRRRTGAAPVPVDSTSPAHAALTIRGLRYEA
ncbi:MAG: hypothetical protein BJ554DRAFT_5706, partial [Olpidium bornovanus]